ncbi:hypothetical protein [Streptomyces halstedii]|uniref:hypothetical protein n=1 Tax=Streptomyces halstedii TaxID=1944 RepID=UPI0038180A7B
MSTDSFNLAPAQSPAGATTTAPAPAPEPLTAAPDATAAPKKTKKPTTPDTPTDGTLAGVIIPGAALTALISLCWLTHQFGLPAVIAGVIACTLAAAAALTAKARRGSRAVRNARKNARNLGGVGGGGSSGGENRRSRGPRSSVNTGSGGGPGSSRANKPSGPRSGKTNSAGATTLGGGSASTKPHGLNSPKPINSASGAGSGHGGHGGAKNQLPKQHHRTNTPSSLGSVGTTKNSNRGNGAGSHKSASDSRLGRIRDRKTTNPTPDLKPHKNGPKQETPTRPLSKTEKKHNKAVASAARRNATAAVDLAKSSLAESKKRKAEDGPRRHRRVKDRLGKTRSKVKRIKAHQENKAELKEARSDLRNLRKLKIRNTTSRIRNAVRPVARRTSRIAAHLWRIGTQTFNQAHMMLGTVRYTNLGPNWVRPLAKLLHAVTSPVARLIHATGSWNRLNAWMYRNTTSRTDPKLKPVSPAAVAAAVARNNTAHQPFTSPGATAPKGTTMSSELSGAMPLMYAAEAVRTAGVMLLINPADNMHGYEATIRQLSDVQAAISQVIQAAAESTRENFAVNPVISDAYDDTAGYGFSLAERLDAIPVLFRMVHAEQLENLENPTPQAAKWDITQNMQD